MELTIENITSITTLISSVAVFWTVYEIRKQRKELYSPKIAVPNISFHIEKTKQGLPIIWKHSSKLIKDKIDSNYSPDFFFKVHNLGFGAAVNVKVVIQYTGIMELALRKILTGDRFHKQENKELKSIIYKYEDQNIFWTFSMYDCDKSEQSFQILPKESSIQIKLPTEIRDFITALIISKTIENHIVRIEEELQIQLKIIYYDIVGKRNVKEYKKLNIQVAATDAPIVKNYSQGRLSFS